MAKKVDESKKRKHRLVTNLNDEELERMRKVSEKKGLDFSSLLRFAILQYCDKELKDENR